jgi:hypothetical protein
MMICWYSKNEGATWEPITVPDNFKDIIEKIVIIPVDKKQRAMIDLSIYNQGIVSAVKFPDTSVFDPELGRHGISNWTTDPFHNTWGLVNMQKTHNQPSNFKARPGITYETNCACGSIYITINDKEVFVRIGKAGGCASALNESVGKLVSAYLQKGGELEDVVKLLSGVSCHSANKETLSCIGAMAEVLKEHLNKEA